MKHDKIEAAAAAYRDELKYNDDLNQSLDKLVIAREALKFTVAELLEEDRAYTSQVDPDDEIALKDLEKYRAAMKKKLASNRTKMRDNDKMRLELENKLAKSDATLNKIRADFDTAKEGVHDWIEQIDAEFRREEHQGGHMSFLKRVFGKGSTGVHSGEAPDPKRRPMHRIKKALAFKIAPQFALMVGAIVYADHASGVNALTPDETKSFTQEQAIEYLSSKGRLGPNTRELLSLSGIEAISDGKGNHTLVALDKGGDLPGADAIDVSQTIMTLGTMENVDFDEARDIFEHYIAPTVLATVDNCRNSVECSGSQETVVETLQYHDEHDNIVRMSWSNVDGMTLGDATPGWRSQEPSPIDDFRLARR